MACAANPRMFTEYIVIVPPKETTDKLRGASQFIQPPAFRRKPELPKPSWRGENLRFQRELRNWCKNLRCAPAWMLFMRLLYTARRKNHRQFQKSANSLDRACDFPITLLLSLCPRSEIVHRSVPYCRTAYCVLRTAYCARSRSFSFGRDALLRVLSDPLPGRADRRSASSLHSDLRRTRTARPYRPSACPDARLLCLRQRSPSPNAFCGHRRVIPRARMPFGLSPKATSTRRTPFADAAKPIATRRASLRVPKNAVPTRRTPFSAPPTPIPPRAMPFGASKNIIPPRGTLILVPTTTHCHTPNDIFDS